MDEILLMLIATASVPVAQAAQAVFQRLRERKRRRTELANETDPAALRRLIAESALQLVIRHYQEEGATVLQEAEGPYDLRIQRGGVEHYVEVKVRNNAADPLVFAANELALASRPGTDLAVVEGLQFAWEPSGLAVTGGTLSIFQDWAAQVTSGERDLPEIAVQGTTPAADAGPGK